MSKTFCRFCELKFVGLYLNCPKCGKWLPPFQGKDTEPDEKYEVMMTNTPTESEFKPVVGYLGLYDVSSDGSIRSLPRMTKGKHGLKLSPGCILKGQEDKNTGYLRVVLCKNGKIKNYSVHRLVAEAFIKNARNLPQVNHISGEKRNNHAENLEWVSHKGNMEHASRNGLVASGMRQRNAKLTNEAVKTIFTSAESLSALASKHGVSPQTISHIKNRVTWSRVTSNLYGGDKK